MGQRPIDAGDGLLGSLSKKAKTGINQENGRHASLPLKKRRRNDSTREIIEHFSYFYFKLKGFKNEIANKKSSIETLSFLRSLSFSINELMGQRPIDAGDGHNSCFSI